MKSLIRKSLVICIFISSTEVLADGNHQILELRNFQLESGAELPITRLSYVTHGKLNSAKSNTILVPSAYGGDHHGYDFMIGPGKALDTDNYFIVATDMFSNGLSSSPSNTPPPFDGPRFPSIAIRDNINAGYKLLTEELGIDHLYAVIGFSMGAQQAFQWAVSHPDFVTKITPYCGSAKEYAHGIVRLEGFKTAIMADGTFNNGDYTEQPTVGLRAGWTHWAAWGTSQEWYRQELYKELGYATVEEYLEWYQEPVAGEDVNDLLTLASTWQNNDVGATPGFNGDHELALRSIEAEVLYMPCETDMYFPLESLKYEAQFIPDVKFVIIQSLWGHTAGGGSSKIDADFINANIKSFLE